MQNRNCAPIIGLLFLGMMTIIMGCPAAMAAQPNHGAPAKKGSIPPIDAAMPSNIETASFGLG